MPEQITWEKIPVEIKLFVVEHWFDIPSGIRLLKANEIMQAMKAEQEKSFEGGRDQTYIHTYEGTLEWTFPDFETWYANTYLK